MSGELAIAQHDPIGLAMALQELSELELTMLSHLSEAELTRRETQRRACHNEIAAGRMAPLVLVK